MVCNGDTFTFFYICVCVCVCVCVCIWGEGWLGFSDLWSDQKPWWNWYLTFCGEFWWSPEGPVSQIHSPHLHVRPWDRFRYFKICSNAKKRVGCEKQREATVPIQSPVKLQPWFLISLWKTCILGSCACSEGPALGQNTLMIYTGERRLIWISGSLIWSRTLMELTFNPCSEFGGVRRVQLAKSTLLTCTLGLLWSFQIF